jgi:hypothetical protein
VYDVDDDVTFDDPDTEYTELLPEDRVLLVNRFHVYPDIMYPLIGVRVDPSNVVKTEEHAASNLKRCASTDLRVPAKRTVATAMPDKQRIMSCVLVSEVMQLLPTDPEGYAHMLMKDESRTRVNGNGTDTFFVRKAGILSEARCEDEGKHFVLNLSIQLSCSLFSLLFFQSQ